jgi:CheY-like chemotaxis protein
MLYANAMMVSMLVALRWRPCRYSVSAIFACAVLSAPLLLAQASDRLTPRDIDEAVKWGMHGSPTPYLLHHKGPSGKINPVIVAAIYTPFLRVALAARAARSAGRDFASSDVTPRLIEPLIYVAFRWYCCVDREHGNDPASWDPTRPPVDYKIAVPGDRLVGTHSRLHVPTEGAPRAMLVRNASRRRILVVEDNDDMRAMLRDALAAAGHQVTVASDGAAAVNETLRERPDVAIIDIGLPVMDGYEVARRIRAADGVPPLLIALTGYGRPEDRERALAAGFIRHVAKPIDPQQLLDVIADVVSDRASI